MDKRRGRPWIAGIFAFIILLMNAFPVIVLAEGATLQPPQLQVPNYEAPNLQAPDWEIPKLDGVQWDMPQLEPPPGIVPQLEESEWDTPQLQAPNGNMPQMQAPNGSMPQLQAPDGRAPALTTPDGSGAAGGRVGSEVPQLTPPGQGPGPQANPPPFGETMAYKMMQFSIKDIMGDTLSYSADMLQHGQVSVGTGAGGYSKVLLTLGLKGLDIGLDGSPYQNYTSGALDIMGAKGAYDSYKLVLQQNANAAARAAEYQRSFSNATSGANAARVPGLITGLNVGIAAISLPFDAFNTYTSFSQIDDPNLTPEQQGEKFLNGVGSLGSTLMDAGVIASVIPGGQTVAVVLVTAGGVLWLGSTALKWIDKLADGKIGKWLKEKTTDAIDWVKDTAKDTWGFVKSIFS
ncbi:hypothetical protein [Brevibacillus panacihumi]|uniref:hypothetical protein n=1 Tax=Brevibacillus panacihumi TaxID=497735 RepID=UPI003D19565E